MRKIFISRSSLLRTGLEWCNLNQNRLISNLENIGMLISVLQCKINSVVSRANLSYGRGSITIGKTLMDAAGLTEYQEVDVNNRNNMSRIRTYVIEGRERNVELNGAAARFAEPGDVVHINAFCTMEYEQAKQWTPIIVEDAL